MYKKVLSTTLLALTIYAGKAQLPVGVGAVGGTKVIVSLPSTAIVSDYMGESGVPYFTIPELNELFSDYHVSSFVQAYPASRFEDTRQLYELTCSSAELAGVLSESYPQYFPVAYVKPGPVPLVDYYPNDYVIPPSWPVRAEYLKYINAPAAWGITKGSSAVTVGVTDWYIDKDHPDLKYKIAKLRANVLDPSEPSHGTIVSGIIAAHTDNGVGYPSIGFKTMLDFSSDVSDAVMLDMSKTNKVLNGSWVYSYYGTDALSLYPPTSTGTKVYDEIYENGALSCFAAGNGHPGGTYYNAWQYLYPASLDHVFSTTSVGWEGTHGVDAFNVKGVHEHTIGDSVHTYQHNPRVDLMAPGIRLGCLVYTPSDPSDKYRWDAAWGTSFSSPQTAGTAALLLSLPNKDCLSPYQLEYLLKQSANSSVLSYAENLKYSGRLGAGALDAGAAVALANGNTGNCNNPVTQTMMIQGIELNHHCAPGFSSNGTVPQLSVIIVNGTPPYTYRWEAINDGAAINGNNSALSNYTSPNPDIISSYGTHLAWYYLTVYDNSPIQKVANKRIKIQLTKDAVADLAMRDSYMDMMDEPNSMALVDPREWNIWLSPDIWNRILADANPAHENPEYFSTPTTNNHMYARVRNVGCAASDGTAKMHLYWTVASSGETWAGDWTTNDIMGTSGLMPAGREITPLTGLAIAALDPGDKQMIVQTWRPQRPSDYTPGSELAVCGLARIEEDRPDLGMHAPEGSVTKVNVSNNNNVVTRNMVVVNLGRKGARGGGPIRVNTASSEEVAATFRLELVSDRTLQPHSGGSLSEYMYVKVVLGQLLDRWREGGMMGSPVEISEEERAVYFDPSTPLHLDNITLHPGERMGLDVSFVLRDGVDLPFDIQGKQLHFRQYKVEGDMEELYGNVTFDININKGGSAAGGDLEKLAGRGQYEIYPNPVSRQLNIVSQYAENVMASITVLDVTGRTMLQQQDVIMNSNSVHPLNMSSLVPGVYFVKISDNKGNVQSFKVSKTD